MRELTSEIKQELLAPFQAAEVRMRTHPYTAAYVTARVVMTRLDEVLPWQWSFRLSGSGSLDSNGVMHQDGILEIRHPDGTVSTFHDRGSAPPDLAKGQAKQAKHAVSDCFKRCAVHAGIGRYLYELSGVQGGRIPKGSLEKALAAVGYRGVWDDRHHGSIGGIREADMEDEPEDAVPAPVVPSSRPIAANHSAASPTAPTTTPARTPVDTVTEGSSEGPSNTGMSAKNAAESTAKENGQSAPNADVNAAAKTPGDRTAKTKGDAEPAARGTSPDPIKAGAAGKATGGGRSLSGVRISEEQKKAVTAAVERGGGSVTSTTFLGWLAKNTANHADSLEKVLAEDVEELTERLEVMANRKKAGG